MSIDPISIAICVVIGIVIGVLASFIVKAGSLGFVVDGIIGLVGPAIGATCCPRWAYTSAPALCRRLSTPSSGRSSCS